MTEIKEHKEGGQTKHGRLIQMFTGEEKIIFSENLERFKSQRFFTLQSLSSWEFVMHQENLLEPPQVV